MAAQQESHLLGIAPELRNIIYYEVARDETSAIIKADESTESFVDAVKAHSPLARVCRQLRDEFGPVFKATTLLTATEYNISMVGFDFERLSQLSDHISKHRDDTDTQRKRLHLHITLDNMTAALLMPFRSQLEDSLSLNSLTPSPLRFAECFYGEKVTFDFRFRAKGMTAEQRSRTITHQQVKVTIERLGVFDPLYKASMSWSWKEIDAIGELRWSLRRAYREHKKAVRNERAHSKDAGMAKNVGVADAAMEVEGLEE